ncbi:hypothetical protein [Streptomyces sp. NPDC048386]|uniref:hypothetical protein n=1 Tax=Streptomyces sp. NPDC048386 TaxID=3365541 RepID=UPI003710DC36
MSSRRKNRQTPAARASRQRAARQAARARRPETARTPEGRAAHPLMALDLPYSGYQTWITPKTVTGTAGDVSEEARALHARLQRLAPLYAGSVPMAALRLDNYIEQGTIPLGATYGVSRIPVADMAALFAGEDAPEVGQLLHELHFRSALVLDDQHIVRLSVPA